MALYAQTSGNLSTNSSSFAKIPGLTFNIPGGVGVTILVILNVPNPYATGNNTPGGMFAINVNGTTSPVQAAFTYNEAQPQSTGRVPTTLVVGVPLIEKEQTIEAMWCSVRGSNVIIDSPATLSAVMS